MVDGAVEQTPTLGCACTLTCVSPLMVGGEILHNLQLFLKHAWPFKDLHMAQASPKEPNWCLLTFDVLGPFSLLLV